MTLRHRTFATLAHRSAFEFLFEVASLSLSSAILDEASKTNDHRSCNSCVTSSYTCALMKGMLNPQTLHDRRNLKPACWGALLHHLVSPHRQYHSTCPNSGQPSTKLNVRPRGLRVPHYPPSAMLIRGCQRFSEHRCYLQH